MERMALLCPLLPTAVFPISPSLTYSLTQCVNNRDTASHSRLCLKYWYINSSSTVLRMSVFDRLAPLIPQLSASSRQTKEQPLVCLTPPVSLSSPIIKKKPIQIPSFDEKGLIHENSKQSNTDRSFVPICSSKTFSRPSWSKSCQYSQRNHAERASTLPRAKPKTYSSPTLSTKPRISIFPAPEPNSSPTLSSLKPKPSDSLHLSASQLSDPSPLLHQPQPKPSVSPTLTVPTPRLSPSPTSLCRGMSLDGQVGKQPSPVAKERRARSITISNTKVEPEAKHDVLDQEALLDFTHPALRRVCPITCRESRHQTYSQRQAATSQSSCFLQGKVGLSKKENIVLDKPKPPPRNIDITAIPKPKSNIKQLQERLPSGATGTQTSLSESEGIKTVNVQRESQSVFDGLATKSSLHRKCIDYLPSRAARFASSEQSYERIYTERSLPVTPKMSFSTEPLWNQSTVSPNIENRRRRFGFNNETKVDTTFLSGPKDENNIRTTAGNSFQPTTASEDNKSPQKHRFWSKAQSQTTQMDVKSAVSQSECVSKDYSCQSRDADRKMEVPHLPGKVKATKR
ncbi:uncharacterized protein LOC127355147 [Dicentrarchus labrax]|uniref:uncharacterized protein LOC127355147 n=1 Tax=Dicentrarchus labrax TaxID=13489 RepID=UPI0021F581EF|nr:uncharacterized protein LOC127355147 [Dicentrarchus labrax]